MAQWITRLTTDQKIAGSNPAGIEKTFCPLFNVFHGAKVVAPPGGLEPPTFRLTAERASRLRHGGFMMLGCFCLDLNTSGRNFSFVAQFKPLSHQSVMV